jgi:hypothetical protein
MTVHVASGRSSMDKGETSMFLKSEEGRHPLYFLHVGARSRKRGRGLGGLQRALLSAVCYAVTTLSGFIQD